MTMFKKNGGFTLVELIVVIAILAILAGVAVPAYSGYIEKANEAADLTTLTHIRTAAQGAMATEGAVTILKITAAEGVISAIEVNVNDEVYPEGDTNAGKLKFEPLYGLKDGSTDEYEYKNADFELYMDGEPAVLKANELGTTWYAAGQEVEEGTEPSWVAGWNEVEPTEATTAPPAGNG